MKKNISALLFLCIVSLNVPAQDFEGKIVYHNTYKSKVPNVPDAQFSTMMGESQVYVIKGGNYKSTTNGTMMQWQLYRKKDNRLYLKMATSPVIYWKDGSVNPDEVQKAEINKKVETIAGHLCDELILTCKSGVQKYYFSPKLKVDPDDYAQHKFGNWSAVIAQTHSLPLKIIVDTPQMVLESVAIEITAGKVADQEFDLPSDSELQKSPY